MASRKYSRPDAGSILQCMISQRTTSNSHGNEYRAGVKSMWLSYANPLQN